MLGASSEVKESLKRDLQIIELIETLNSMTKEISLNNIESINILNQAINFVKAKILSLQERLVRLESRLF